MPGPSKKLIEQLEQVNENIQTKGYMWIFQPGATTYIFDTKMGGVNCNIDQQTAATTKFVGASSTNTAYIWDQTAHHTYQNHSILPVFMTAHYCRFRDHVPVALGTSLYNKFNEPVAEMFVRGLLNKGIASSDIDFACQGFYDLTNFSYGEGTGAAGGGTGTRVDWAATGYVNKAVSVPLGISLKDSEDFNQFVEVYHRKSFVLQPEELISLTLSEKDMKYRKIVESDVTAELDPYDPSTYHYNKYCKFIIIQIEGSLVGQGMNDTNTLADNTLGWAPTTAQTDTLDYSTLIEEMATHGGQLYALYHQRWKNAVLTNEGRESTTMSTIATRLGTPDGSHVQVTEVNHQG